MLARKVDYKLINGHDVTAWKINTAMSRPMDVWRLELTLRIWTTILSKRCIRKVVIRLFFNNYHRSAQDADQYFFALPYN